MKTLTPLQQNAPAEHWLNPGPTQLLIESSAHPFAMCDKSSRNFDPLFPRPTRGKWLESDLLQYLAVKRVAAQPLNNPPDRRANTARRRPL